LQRLSAGWCNQLHASTLRRCGSLREVDLRSSEDVTDAVLAALAYVSTLETLKLSHCREVRDVRALARSVSVRRLNLEGTDVSDTGIAGLECIPTLTWLSLASCVHHQRDEPVPLQVTAHPGHVGIVGNGRWACRSGDGACAGIRLSAPLCSCRRHCRRCPARC
jgi:hypothetical protein